MDDEIFVCIISGVLRVGNHCLWLQYLSSFKNLDQRSSSLLECSNEAYACVFVNIDAAKTEAIVSIKVGGLRLLATLNSVQSVTAFFQAASLRLRRVEGGWGCVRMTGALVRREGAGMCSVV